MSFFTYESLDIIFCDYECFYIDLNTQIYIKTPKITKYSVMPNFEELVPILLERGWKNVMEECSIKVGMPIKPMLAIPLNNLKDISTRFGDNITDKSVVLEYKYDGERAQVSFFTLIYTTFMALFILI